MKETYSVKTPNKIKFGDPWYFKQFSGDELERVVVDMNPPSHFKTIITLEELKNIDYSDITLRTMNIYMASDVFMPFYLCDMLFDSQSCENKNISVDSAEYYLSIDDKEYTVYTAADGYWGNYSEITHSENNKTYSDGIIINISFPDDISFVDMRNLLNYFFEDVNLIEDLSEQDNSNNLQPNM